MWSKCCRRFLSFGFATLIEPIPSGKTHFNGPRQVCGDMILYQKRFISLSHQDHKRYLLPSCSRDLTVVRKHNFSSSPITSANTIDPNDNKEKSLQPENSDEVDESNQSIFQRFKSTYKKHGKILLTVHVATSAVWFGSFYYVARSGIDVVALMEAYNFPPKLIGPFKHAGLGDIAVMYLLYKLATPVRYTVTLGGTNLAIRYLKKTGYLEPVNPSDSIRSLMKDSSDVLKEKRSEFVEQSRDKIKSFRDKDKSSR